MKYLIILLCLISYQASAQTFSQLPPAGPITGSEFVPIDQNGTTVRTTTNNLQFGGTVGVSQGGTGSISFLPNAILTGNGTGPLNFISPMNVNGYCLVSNGTQWAPSSTCGGVGPSISAYSVLGNNTASTTVGTSIQSLILGTPGFTDTGVAAQFTGNINGYYQQILQNTNTGSNASADYIAGGNDMTAFTHYLDVGKNGSAGALSPFINADAGYLYTADNELDLGALGTSGIINLAVGTASMTQVAIGTTGVVIGTATGGAQGSGTINAQGLYVNGVVIGSGSVNSGTQYQMAYYPSTGSAVSGNNGINTDANNDLIVTGATATSFSVGTSGATNPIFDVDASVANAVTGVTVQGVATGSVTTLTATDPGTNASLTLKGKAAGIIALDALTGTDQMQINGIARLTVAGPNYILTPSTLLTATTVRFLYTAPADITLTASTEAPEIYYNLSAIRQHATGALALQRDYRIAATTHSFVGASALTTEAALSIDNLPGCGTNGTCTNSIGLYHPTTALTHTGPITNSYPIYVAADTGATNNYAAYLGGSVGIGSTNPVYLLDVRGTAPTIASNGLPVFNAINIQKFSAAGTATYTPTTGTQYVVVKEAGGGGGGGGASVSPTFGAAGGGGSGACSIGTFTFVQANGVTITVGAAGSGGAASTGAAGSTGGATSFGALMTAPAGVGGSGATGNGSNAGGAGGAAGTGGQENLIGNPGSPSESITAATLAMSGKGGDNPCYPGGGVISVQGGAGGSATNYGSGGAGATGLSASNVGGAGTAGYVEVTEFISQ